MSRNEWSKKIKKHASANSKTAIFQLINTVIPYLILLIGTMYLVENKVNPIIICGLIILDGLLLVRLFILFHDCTHQSFTPSKKANDILGYILGILAFTSYVSWQKEHNIHHGAVGNLDRRGTGDIWTLTIDEYNGKSSFIRFIYRLFRNPWFLFTVAPIFLFAILQRIPKKTANKKELVGHLITNISILALGVSFSIAFSPATYFIVQYTILFVGSSVGVWMFYVQHQFEEVYWEEAEQWDSVQAALKGSTYYRLPAILEWFSGYIGYHHIHHLNSRIPNYNLKACYREIAELKDVRTVGFWESLKLATLQIYDNTSKRLISFREMNQVIVKG